MLYELKLNDQHMAVLSAALQEMPVRVAMPVINEINSQLAAQAQAPAPAAEQARHKDDRPAPRGPQSRHDQPHHRPQTSRSPAQVAGLGAPARAHGG